MKRLVLAFLLAFLLVMGGAVPPPTQAAGTGLVTWLVNHKKKTITVTVKIEIYLSDCATGASYCGVSDADIASYIAKNIKQAWNGHHYKCYQLIFDVKVSVVPDRFRVSAGSVGILVDRSDMQGVRSDTRPTVDSVRRSAGSDAWQSNDPAQRLDVTNSYISPSTWSYPPRQEYTYAHEFGHVIGLDHYYRGDELIEGAPDDVMNKSYQPFVSQETIDRAVERSADLMVDTDSKPADPHKLRCDNLFKATLKGDETYYGATHFVDSIARPPCSAAPFTHSTDQSLQVESQPVELQLVEDAELAPLFYQLIPTFDVLTLQNGMHGGGRAQNAIGLFDLPISVAVTRSNSTPASGDIPPVLDFKSGVCTGGDGGQTTPPDCGNRRYDSWLAMVHSDDDELWPAGSSIPIQLRDVGYQSPRLEALYKNCSGPTPWPGLFVEDGSNVTVTKGTLPAVDVIRKVATDWYTDDIPGRVTIVGKATSDQLVTGHLERHTFNWTLTLCPLNDKGETPPGCP